MSQVTIISGVERRRVWADEQKRGLVAAACEPGANVAEIARRADLRPSQLYRWRRDLAKAAPGFAAVMVSTDREQVVGGAAAVVIELGGAVLRIAADAPPALVSAVVRSLRRRSRFRRVSGSGSRPGPPICDAGCTGWRCRCSKA